MGLPGNLGVGFLSVYGLGSNVSPNNVVAPSNFVFNSIYSIWNGDGINASVGEYILYKKEDVFCTLAYDNGQYEIIPVDKIIYSENVP